MEVVVLVVVDHAVCVCVICRIDIEYMEKFVFFPRVHVCSRNITKLNEGYAS